MYNLYWESKGSKGITLTKLARDAPAPIRTNKAGRAQHKRVDDVRNKVRKLIALLFISCSVYFNDTEVCCWHCKKKGVITHAKDVELKGWTNGKTIDDIKRPFRFYAKRMRCKVCKKNSQSDDEGFIEMFGPRATLFFQQQCGHHSHNVSADLEDGGWKHHIYSTTTSAC